MSIAPQMHENFLVLAFIGQPHGSHRYRNNLNLCQVASRLDNRVTADLFEHSRFKTKEAGTLLSDKGICQSRHMPIL